MNTLKTKSLIRKVDGSNWFGTDYTINLYRGCCHGCIYCDSRSKCYNIESFDSVRLKENTDEILRSELKSKKLKGVIGLGAMSDSYNPFEKEAMATRKALEIIYEYGFGVSIETKSSLIARDKDILKKISERNSAIIKLSITTADDALSKIIEPNASPSSDRFKALAELKANGIFCGVLLAPVLPFITNTKENISNIIKKAKDANVDFVYAMFGVTLRDIQRDYFYKMLDLHFPKVKEKYIITYLNQYDCRVQNEKELYSVLKEECEKYGILYKMNDIIKAYKKEKVEQLRLF